MYNTVKTRPLLWRKQLRHVLYYVDFGPILGSRNDGSAVDDPPSRFSSAQNNNRFRLRLPARRREESSPLYPPEQIVTEYGTHERQSWWNERRANANLSSHQHRQTIIYQDANRNATPPPSPSCRMILHQVKHGIPVMCLSQQQLVLQLLEQVSVLLLVQKMTQLVFCVV